MARWWKNRETWCEPQIEIFADHNDPWFCEYMDKRKDLLECTSGLYPGSRPRNLLKSSYAESIRRAWPECRDNDQACLSHCNRAVLLIDSILRCGFKDLGNPSRTNILCRGSVSFVVFSDGKLSILDGNTRACICWLEKISFPAKIVAIHPKWQGTSSYFRNDKS